MNSSGRAPDARGYVARSALYQSHLGRSPFRPGDGRNYKENRTKLPEKVRRFCNVAGPIVGPSHRFTRFQLVSSRLRGRHHRRDLAWGAGAVLDEWKEKAGSSYLTGTCLTKKRPQSFPKRYKKNSPYPRQGLPDFRNREETTRTGVSRDHLRPAIPPPPPPQPQPLSHTHSK